MILAERFMRGTSKFIQSFMNSTLTSEVRGVLVAY